MWKQALAAPAGQAQQAQYSFDADGRMTQIKYPGTNNGWTYWTYNGAGLSEPTDNLNTTGTPYTYAYNILGQQTSMQSYTEWCYDPESGYYSCWQTLAHSATYNASGQLTAWNEGTESSYNSLTRSYSATRGWLTAMTAGSSLNLAYSYLDNGRASTMTDYVNPAFRTTTYQYDSLNRLTQATAANTSSVTQWQLAWTYDEFGNRLTQTPTGGTPYSPPSSTLAYNSATNRITTSGYTYDNNGNMTALPGTTLTYDVFDRVTQAVKSGVTSQYAYDAFGKRVAVTVSGTTTVHFFDIGGRLLTGGIYGNQVYFAGQRVGQYTDRLGSVRYGNGSTSHYYPYGEEVASTGNNRYKFAETFRDSDTGLDYAMARYLSSSIGRFLSADPYRASAAPLDPQTWNRYAYVHNDPINYFDPMGTNEADPAGYNHRTGEFFISGMWGFDMFQFGEDEEWAWVGRTVEGTIGSITWPVHGPGWSSGGSTFEPLKDAVGRAKLDLEKPGCAQLFTSQNPAAALEAAYANNQIRVAKFGKNIKAATGAMTNSSLDSPSTPGGAIYIASNRYFFTGQFNGGPVTQTAADFSGLTQAQVQEIILIHEMLHLTGTVGADNKKQELTLGNGQVVRGSSGVTAAVKQHCID